MDLFDVETVKVYYDCGQSPVTNLLHKTFEEELGKRVEFAQGVHPANYRLFQLAIDAGGVVTVPEGVYLCGTLYLRSNGGLDLSPRPPFSRTSRSSTAAS